MEPNRDHELNRVLREWQVAGAPPELEARVISIPRSAIRAPNVSEGLQQPLTHFRSAAGIAAAIAALGWIVALLSGVPGPPRKPPVDPPPLLRPLLTSDAGANDPGGEAAFIPVPYTLPLDSYETATVLRINLPVAALIGAGYRMNESDPTAIVLADIVVGDDGRTHAVRLVPVGQASRPVHDSVGQASRPVPHKSGEN